MTTLQYIKTIFTHNVGIFIGFFSFEFIKYYSFFEKWYCIHIKKMDGAAYHVSKMDFGFSDFHTRYMVAKYILKNTNQPSDEVRDIRIQMFHPHFLLDYSINRNYLSRAVDSGNVKTPDDILKLMVKYNYVTRHNFRNNIGLETYDIFINQSFEDFWLNDVKKMKESNA